MDCSLGLRGPTQMTLGWLHRASAEPKLNETHRLTKAVLVTCPIIFTCFVGIYSRSYSDQHIVPSGTPAQDAVALAYVPYVKATQQIFKGAAEPTSRAAMLKLGNQWDVAVQKDELQPLIPVSFEDNPEDGARGAIFKAKSTLVSGILDDAIEQKQNGNFHEAANEALLATRISESLKYCDFASVNNATTEEERAMAVIRSALPHLDITDRETVRNGLALIKDNSDQLATLTRYSRVQYYDYLGRMRMQPVSIEDVHRTVLVTKRITSDPSGKDTLDFVRKSMLDSPSDDGPEYLSELRLAWISERSNVSEIDQMMSLL